MSEKNITLTNLTKEQRDWLDEKATSKSMTVTGFIKHWIESGIRDEKKRYSDDAYCEGFWD